MELKSAAFCSSFRALSDDLLFGQNQNFLVGGGKGEKSPV